MSLIYLITSLPRLQRHGSPPVERAAFVARCRDHLHGVERAEFEHLVRVEAVEESVRLHLQAKVRDWDPAVTMAHVLGAREDGRSFEDMPDWLTEPSTQHEWLRRHYFELTLQAQTEFLRRWANFRIDIGEVVTALLCRAEGVSRDAFLVQMEGSFDASAPLIIARWEDPTLGLGQRFPWLPRVIAALGEDDLMAMTRALDGIVWDKIEELRPLETFSIETLLAYYLQLRILEREASWDATKGAAVLDAILARAATPSTEARS